MSECSRKAHFTNDSDNRHIQLQLPNLVNVGPLLIDFYTISISYHARKTANFQALIPLE